MSDFFTRLAERTLGSPSLIAPRIVGLSADAVLRFRHSYDTDTGDDGGVLETDRSALIRLAQARFPRVERTCS